MCKQGTLQGTHRERCHTLKFRTLSHPPFPRQAPCFLVPVPLSDMPLASRARSGYDGACSQGFAAAKPQVGSLSASASYLGQPLDVCILDEEWRRIMGMAGGGRSRAVDAWIAGLFSLGRVEMQMFFTVAVVVVAILSCFLAVCNGQEIISGAATTRGDTSCAGQEGRCRGEMLWGDCGGKRANEGTGKQAGGEGEQDQEAVDAWLLGVVDQWLSNVQGNESAPWIVARPQYGLGNRIMSGVSSMALAISTGRRLYVDWGEPFSDMLDSPVSSSPLVAGESTDLLDLSAHARKFADSAAGIACGGMMEAGGLLHGDSGSFGVEVRSDQYYLPLVLMSDHGQTTLCRRGKCEKGWADHVFRVFGRWLVRPNERVREAVQGWEADWGRCRVGVHVRSAMYGWEAKQVPLVESDVALKCAKQVAFNASVPVGPGEVFIAATDGMVHEEAGRVLGDRSAGTRGETERLLDGGDGEWQAMMDLVILSRCCHGIVASVHSTLSYAAHGLAGVVPWVVSSASQRGESRRVGRSRCAEARGYGPCFHGWESVKGAVGLCYDEARHVAYLPRPCWY